MKTLEMQPKSGEQFISIQSPELNRLISGDKINTYIKQIENRLKRV